MELLNNLANELARLEPTANLGANNSRNNPGNIEDGPYAQKQPGYLGPDPNNPRFARFSSGEGGAAAQVNLLRNSPKYKNKSVADIIQTYSPLGDNSESSVRNYIGYVASRLGLDPSKPVSSNQVAAMAGAMREFETGRTVKTNFKPYAGQLRAPKVANQNGGGNGITPRTNYSRWLDGGGLPPEVANPNQPGLPQGATEAIFGSEGKIQERTQAVDTAISDMGQRIDVLDAATQAAQAQELESKAKQVEDSRRINDEIVAGADQLARTVQPVIEARTRVADQLDKLATMNPLERSLRGIFDLNYDREYLQGQLAQFDKTMQARLYDFDYLNHLQDVGLQAIDRRYGIDTAMSNLNMAQATQDVALVNQRLGLASSALSQTRQSLETQSQLIVAQNQARGAILDRMDTPTIIQHMTNAQQNGGMTEIDGIQFSYTDLRDVAERNQQQDRQIRSAQLALAQGEISLAQGIAEDLTRSMTRSQLEEAAANGGVYKGIQLDQTQITAGLENFSQRATREAQTILMQMPAATANQAAFDISNSSAALYHRAKNMLSPSDLRASSTQLHNIAQYSVALATAARDPNTPPEVMQALLAKAQEAQQGYQKLVSQSILRSVGGDKRAAGYVESFVYGTPLAAGTAAEALTYFAVKGSLPDGLAVSPESKQIFVRAQQIVQEVQKADPKAPMERIQREVQQKLAGYAAQIIGTPRLEDTLASLPAHARQLGHPFGHIKDDYWRKLYSDANNAAAADIANQLKTSVGNVLKMKTTMKPLENTQAGNDLFDNFMKVAGGWNATEQQYIIQNLDSGNPIVAGQSNSELLEDLLYSPAFQSQINRKVQLIEGNSFGDYLVGPLTQGATGTAVMQYAGQVRDQASAARVSAQTAAREKNRIWGNNNTVRVMTVLRSIPQIGPKGADMLRPFVQESLKKSPVPSAMTLALTGSAASVPILQNYIGGKEEEIVLDALRRAKFQDPVMEQLRKAAIQHWGEYSDYADTAMQSFSEEAKR